jgi:hypothetical protein
MDREAPRITRAQFWTIAIILAVALAIAVNVAVPLLTDDTSERDPTEQPVVERRDRDR